MYIWLKSEWKVLGTYKPKLRKATGRYAPYKPNAMFKTAVLILSLWGFSFSSGAQTISLSHSELIKTLCKKWKMDFSAANGNHIPTPNYRDYSIIFYENYDFKVINNGAIEIGKWCYNLENKNIEISFNKRESTLRVYSVSQNELVIVLKENIRRNPMDHPIVFSHFSPK